MLLYPFVQKLCMKKKNEKKKSVFRVIRRSNFIYIYDMDTLFFIVFIQRPKLTRVNNVYKYGIQMFTNIDYKCLQILITSVYKYWL